jgi:O-antigen ligase
MQALSKNKSQKNYQVKWIFFSALAITLYFDIQAQDPFNLPKFWLLMLITPVILAYIFTSKTVLTKEEKDFYKILRFFCIVYFSFLLVSSYFSYSFQVAILGESFRRNGILTYLGFLAFFIASVKFIRFENILFGIKIIVLAGSVTGLYSLIQISGNDWVKWSAANQVISTFGNTNFAGAGMALFAIVIFGSSILNFKNRLIFFGQSAVFLVLVYAIVKTNARQAIIILLLGLSIFVSLFVFRKSKKIWAIFVSIGFLFAVFTMLGALKLGPLQDLVYKDSISVRQYYWLAGIEMFKSNPLLGVGPDHYGVYFKQFREVGYPLAYGWGITSSNAHNVFIQNFATGGVVAGIAYLIIQILIGYRAIKLIRSTEGSKQVISVLLFSTWIAYQAQSLISIEFIGVSVWGWVLGGSLIGLSFQEQNIVANRSKQSVELNITRLILVATLLVGSFVVANPLRQGEKAMWRQSIQFDPNNKQQVEIFNKAVADVLDNGLLNSDYKNLTAANFLSKGDQGKALEILTATESKDPRNLDTLALLVDTYEKTGNFDSAIRLRIEISKYDPWNAQNYLGLAQLYKVTSNFSEMSKMVDKILAIAPNDPISKVAQKEFSPIAE